MQTTNRIRIASIAVAALLAVAGDSAGAETADHLECYKAKDTLDLLANIDLESPQFGDNPNCTVSKAKFFCVPAVKTVNGPVAQEHMHGSDPGDRVCYELKCKDQSKPDPGETLVADQFGGRTLTRQKTAMLCTPAVKVQPGWLGRTEIHPEVLDDRGDPYLGDQYWTDTDGVDPATPGCHYPFESRSIAGVCSDPLNAASKFGEFCNPAVGQPNHADGFAEGTLIESNPAAGVCHPHKDGLGHPDVYDCDAYCKGIGSPAHTGVCVAAPCADDVAIESAHCECTPPLP